MYLAGIDIGTTGCKCSVYSNDGIFICEEYQEYEITVSEKAHTIDVDMIWENIKSIMKKITIKQNHIGAICVTSFGEASVILDEDGHPLSQAYLFTDPNGESECEEIVSQLGREYILNHTGVAPGKMYSVSKWLWQKRTAPELWDKAKYICLVEDYIVYRLSGMRQIDYSLATRTMAFDVHNLCWDENILNAVGVSKEMLSTPVPTGTKADKMLGEVREELGFANHPLIVSGCHDQIAAAIGSGVLGANQAVDGTGTVECISCTYREKDEINEEILHDNGYAIVPYREGVYVTYAFSYTGGALLKWYRDKIAPYESELSVKKGINPYQNFNEKIQEVNPTGLLILPHFSGAGTPYMNNDAKGVIVGLGLNTTKEQIYQGLMEGTAYEMRLNLERLEEAGIKLNSLYVTGGGANSLPWLQIKADIFGKPVIPLESMQTGTLACIMLAGVACGCYSSLEDGAEIFACYKEEIKPRTEFVEKYEALYQEYKKLYPRLYQD